MLEMMRDGRATFKACHNNKYITVRVDEKFGYTVFGLQKTSSQSVIGLSQNT